MLNYEEEEKPLQRLRGRHLLSDIVGASPIPNQRHEYGVPLRVWFSCWFLADPPPLDSEEVPTTVYAVGMALERNPEAAMVDANWEIASQDIAGLITRKTRPRSENTSGGRWTHEADDRKASCWHLPGQTQREHS